MRHLVCLLAVFLAAACGGPAPQSEDAGPGDAGSPDASVPSEPQLLQSFCAIQPTTFPNVDTSDASFTPPTEVDCFESACLCGLGTAEDQSAVDAIARCDGEATGFYWGQGSVIIRVEGRASGKCLAEVVIEVEGGVSDYSCQLPLPIAPWPGLLSTGDTSNGGVSILSGIEHDCQLTSQCNVLTGASDPCASSIPRCSPSAKACH